MFRITYKNQYVLAFLSGLSIPVSIFFTNIFCLIVLIVVIFEGNNKEKLSIIIHHPISQIALCLFSLGLVGLLFTSADFSDASYVLKKYREFLYIPMFLIFFQDPKSRTWGLYGFFAAMGLTLLATYIVALTGFGASLGRVDESGTFKNYITQNLLLALAIYFIAVQFSLKQRWKYPLATFILLALYNMLFMSMGRTGYLVIFALTSLLFFQIYKLRGLVVACLALSLLSVLLYNTSMVFQDRINIISEDLERYQQGDVDLSNSIGSRLEFYENSLLLIKEHPVTGSGTGSFATEYQNLAQQKGQQAVNHPHNEYLLIAVQWGVIGLSLFIYLLYLLWKSSRQLEKPQQMMAQGLVLAIVIGCLFNSFWLDTTEGHIFAFFIGLLYAKLPASDELGSTYQES